MENGIKVGGVQVENISEVGDVIVRVLEANAADNLKIEALEALTRVAKVENVTIQGANISSRIINT